MKSNSNQTQAYSWTTDERLRSEVNQFKYKKEITAIKEKKSSPRPRSKVIKKTT